MDSFGDNFVSDLEVDPAAEFLAREQDQLAGLEDEIPSATMSSHNGSINNMKIGDSKIGLRGDTESGFEIIDPVVSTPELIETLATPPVIQEEPEKIKKWREEQKTRLEQKDAEEETKREEWREVAKKELEEWYKHHTETISKTKATNRNAEKQFVAEADDVEPGTEWERIAKLCDFNPKSSRTSKDVSRMRSIILQLKQSPPAPLTV